MIALIQEYLRKGEWDVYRMVQSLEIENVDAVFVEGVNEYVAKLMSDFEAQPQGQKQ